MTSKIPVEIVPYDPQWPALFEQEKAALLAAIGSYVCCIEHIGSTAVPGLDAKPVIDILIGVRYLGDAPAFIPPLEALGYDYIPRHEAVLPERRYLHRIVDGKHTHHLHIVEPESEFFRTHLLFRDYLRNHPEDARCYAELKYRLAEEFRNDRESYTSGKSALIEKIMQKANQNS